MAALSPRHRHIPALSSTRACFGPRGLFRLTRYYDSIRALMLPPVDLTLQVESKVLDTLIPFGRTLRQQGHIS